MPTKYTATKTSEQVEKFLYKDHTILKMSTKEIDDWVDDNVADLNDVKTVLKLLIKIIKAQK
jgi:hypothetical protein